MCRGEKLQNTRAETQLPAHLFNATHIVGFEKKVIDAQSVRLFDVDALKRALREACSHLSLPSGRWWWPSSPRHVALRESDEARLVA